MTAAVRILVVDDEPDLRAMLTDYLGAFGMTVRQLESGAGLADEVGQHRPDLVLLDVNMPGEDGFTLLRRLRSVDPLLPVIMLTAAGAVHQRIDGLSAGADDYVVKPFDVRELLARIHAVLDRVAASRTAQPAPEIAGFGPHLLDRAGRRLLTAAGEEIALTALEFDLIALFAANPRKVLSRAKLRTADERIGASETDRAIDIRIARLRKKVETDPVNAPLIRTVRGQGYVFDPDRTGS